MPRLPALDSSTNANRSPHVVILGAGASVAALPHGDRRGRQLPVMRTLVDTLDLRHDLERAGVDLASGNFEQIYAGLVATPTATGILLEMEGRVRDYFGALHLPDYATVYDTLLLTLRDKDVVATFNWDPLLLQAYRRVADLGRAPKILFLHGNVGVGYCASDRVAGVIGGTCGTCGGPLTASPLLFPVAQKDYRADPFLASQWDALDEYLEHAFMLTIFGYSAPASDAAARELLQRAWTRNATRDLAEIEIVDVRAERTWSRTGGTSSCGITSASRTGSSIHGHFGSPDAVVTRWRGPSSCWTRGMTRRCSRAASMCRRNSRTFDLQSHR